MTKDEASKRFKEIIDEYIIESDRIMTEAQENGTWPHGLDGDKEFFVELDAKTEKRYKK